MNWILLSILSALTGSLTKILQKILLKDEQSDMFAFSFVFQLLVAGLFLIYTLTTKTLEFPNLSDIVINVFIMTLLYSVGNLCVFKAFKLAEVSEVSIIFASSTVWSIISSVYFLHEKIVPVQILGIVFILLGIIAINYVRSNWQLNKGHVFAVIGAFCFGIAFTNDAYIVSKYSSIGSYMILAFSLPGIVTIFYSPKSLLHVPHFFKPKIISYLLLCGIIYALSAILIFTAYKNGGQVSLISPISQSNIIFTVIFSYIFLYERSHLLKKAIGLTASFIGVLLLIT